MWHTNISGLKRGATDLEEAAEDVSLERQRHSREKMRFPQNLQVVSRLLLVLPRRHLNPPDIILYF